MDINLYITFLTVCMAVLLTPGPSVTIAVIHGARYGAYRSSIVGLGDISANLLQMIAAVAGLGLIISKSAFVFFLIKWIGVGYLIYLGVMMILKAGRAIPRVDSIENDLPPLFWHYRQGFIVAASSPKAILFYGALFPQFINPAADLLPQFTLLALTCAFLDWIIVSIYGAIAARASSLAKGNPWIDRVGGSTLLGTAGFIAGVER